MIDEVGFLPVDTRQMFPQIDIIILGVCGTACPNPPPPQKKKKKKKPTILRNVVTISQKRR